MHSIFLFNCEYVVDDSRWCLLSKCGDTCIGIHFIAASLTSGKHILAKSILLQESRSRNHFLVLGLPSPRLENRMASHCLNFRENSFWSHRGRCPLQSIIMTNEEYDMVQQSFLWKIENDRMQGIVLIERLSLSKMSRNCEKVY